MSIAFAILSMIFIQILWSENENQHKNSTISSCYAEAFNELKKREVLSVGISESITLAVQSLFLFLWTPILLQSTPYSINIGFIFITLVTSIIAGTKMFEIGIIYLKSGLYQMLCLILFSLSLSLYLIYSINSFPVRLILFAIINGFSGFYIPLFSFIKYKILNEKHRAFLMNIFRIPLNIYVIICLLSLKYLDPFSVSIIDCIIYSDLSYCFFNGTNCIYDNCISYIV